jgi:hypothetical protein
MKDATRCIAITAKGDQCLRPALKGRAVCPGHVGPSRFEDLEAPSLDIIRQALTADAEGIDPSLRIKMALQVLDRAAKRAPQPATEDAHKEDRWVEAMTDDEREQLKGMLDQLRVLKAVVRARLGLGTPSGA